MTNNHIIINRNDQLQIPHISMLDKHRTGSDMSSVDLDGSLTTTMRCGEEVGYQGRKKRETINVLYIIDCQGIPIIMSSPKSGEYHDIHDIESIMQAMINDHLAAANIRTDGLFLNVNAGFDCTTLRSALEGYGVVVNIRINKRNAMPYGRTVVCRVLFHRTNQCMDIYRTILDRFETTLRN